MPTDVRTPPPAPPVPGSEGEEVEVPYDLLVGCDGEDSAVRRILKARRGGGGKGKGCELSYWIDL